MPVIEVNHLTKAFRTYKKQPGFAGAVRGLFHRQYEQTVAVNQVSFKIEPGELVGFLSRMLHTVVHKDSISAIDPVPAIPGFFLWPRVGLWPRHFLECFRSSGINRDNSPMISSAALDSSSAPISLAVSMDRLDCALSSGFGSARCFIEDSLALTNFHP